MKKFPNIYVSVIGAGKVGTTLASVIASKKSEEIQIAAVTAKSLSSLRRAKKIIGDSGSNIIFTKNNRKAAEASNCIFICTPDDYIEAATEEVFSLKNHDYSRYTAIHFSGSKSLKALLDAKKKGSGICSMHPLKSFAAINEAIKTISGTVYGITFDGDDSRKIAEKIVSLLGGIAVKVDDDKKPLYHAAACVASNYLVTLLNYAVSIHEKIGINTEDSTKGLMSLVDDTIVNIKKFGTKKSLTGPITRGDTGTIQEHLDNFEKYLEKDFDRVYKIMGIETCKIALYNEWIDGDTALKLNNILKSP